MPSSVSRVYYSVQSPYAASPLVNLSRIQSAQDISILKLVTQYRQRECAFQDRTRITLG